MHEGTGTPAAAATVHADVHPSLSPFVAPVLAAPAAPLSFSAAHASNVIIGEVSSDGSRGSTTVILHRLGRLTQHMVDMGETVPLPPSGGPAQASRTQAASFVDASQGSMRTADMLVSDQQSALMPSVMMPSVEPTDMDDKRASPSRDVMSSPIRSRAELSYQRPVTSSSQVAATLKRFQLQQARFASLQVPQSPVMPANAVVMPLIKRKYK